MSLLTEVTVIVETCPGDRFTAAITAPLDGDPRGQSLRKLDTDGAGGSKWYCSGIYAAMFNYVTPSDVKDFLDSLDWTGYTATVVIDYEHDEEIEVLRFPRSRHEAERPQQL
jgi:hypothetical protein